MTLKQYLNYQKKGHFVSDGRNQNNFKQGISTMFRYKFIKEKKKEKKKKNKKKIGVSILSRYNFFKTK